LKNTFGHRRATDISQTHKQYFYGHFASEFNYFVKLITMDIIWIIVGALLLLIGLAGSILPALPGPPVALVGLGLLKFHSTAAPEVTWTLLIWLGVFVGLVTVLDYYLPIWGTKKFGGTAWGQWGSTIGLLLGIFVPVLGPVTFILGPFFGAVIGELMGGQDMNKALKSGWGSFIGFLGGTLAKILLCAVMIFFFINVLI
jgi:uncharacterized protein YqgC (DUF456 family)